MSHVFISYSKKNKEYARRLADYLLQNGFDVWIDDRIDYGDNWQDVMFKTVCDCSAFVVIMTTEARKSRWVQREVAWADEREKKMFPLLHEGERWPIFVLTQYIDVTDNSLPDDRFLFELAKYVPPKQMQGNDVTPQTESNPPSSSSIPETERLLGIMLNPSVQPQERAGAGRQLAVLGDHRPGIGLNSDGAPDIAWSDIIEVGSFLMGGDSEALNEWEGAEFNLSYSFYIARYPITYTQYEAFVEAGGYQEQKYWTEVGWQWKADRNSPLKGWNSPQWHISNHPVIGITWYEAIAFVNWIDDLRIQGKLAIPPNTPDNYVVRLPTEAEWEKAARHPDRRKFPWGDAYLSGYANVDEVNSRIGQNNLQRTSAVGIYPQGVNSAHGAEDLSGNVWEWCLSQWDDKYQFPENNAVTGDAARVLRGGSWNLNVRRARCASRARFNADMRDVSLGFRIAFSIRT